MKKKFKYVEVQWDDASAGKVLRHLHRTTFPGDKYPDFNLGYWWLVYHDAQPVAFAGLHPSFNYEDTGYLCRVGVLKAHRGLGLQRRLIRVREKKARALGWRFMVTDTTVENPASANSLIRCGYKCFWPGTQTWRAEGTIYLKREL